MKKVFCLKLHKNDIGTRTFYFFFFFVSLYLSLPYYLFSFPSLFLSFLLVFCFINFFIIFFLCVVLYLPMSLSPFPSLSFLLLSPVSLSLLFSSLNLLVSQWTLCINADVYSNWMQRVHHDRLIKPKKYCFHLTFK